MLTMVIDSSDFYFLNENLCNFKPIIHIILLYHDKLYPTFTPFKVLSFFKINKA